MLLPWIPFASRLRKNSRDHKSLARRCHPVIEVLEDRLAPATFIVTGTSDDAGILTLIDKANQVYTVTSFRRAIDESNGSVGVRDTISFQIKGNPTIMPGSQLSAITDPVDIDGTTQAGYDKASFLPAVVLDGSEAGKLSNGLVIRAGSTTVKGLSIVRFNGAGIRLAYDDERGQSSDGNTITNTYLGTDSKGTAGLGNTYGVVIEGARLNTIGGNTKAQRNVISGNKADGILLLARDKDNVPRNNDISGNYIGTSPLGTAALGNAGNGIQVLGGSQNKIRDNVISGNENAGIFLGTTTVGGTKFIPLDNTVAHNTIGLTAAGKFRLGNTTGVVIDGGKNNTIGGSTSVDRNIISGNKVDGVLIIGRDISQLKASPQENIVRGNYIGTDPTGMTDLGNGRSGVRIQGGASNHIVSNVISGNRDSGVYLTVNGSEGAPNQKSDPLAIENDISGNTIGLAVDGETKLGQWGQWGDNGDIAVWRPATFPRRSKMSSKWSRRITSTWNSTWTSCAIACSGKRSSVTVKCLATRAFAPSNSRHSSWLLRPDPRQRSPMSRSDLKHRMESR
ncbi:MAG: right-handed parallel beta-helix repeat-containing protein [Gemmataceae bacterium]|nr:right-handed parallel beta-helix repeat-containing protein [Gemmataceae bacterium]